ncbi:MAG: DNA-binding protein YbiB [Elusimicrobia bacterium]|nr:MAG: DNA-binding protein YbiB [Elusimicrobiota bacterium]
MEWASVIRELGRGATGSRDLTQDEAARLYAALLDGQVPDLEQGAIAIALRMKTESVDEMAGFLAAASERLPKLQTPPGSVRPVVLPTYNGARRSANLTPLLALLLQRQRVPVLVHGLGDGYGRISSEQIFRSLGIAACASVVQAQQALVEQGLAYVPLPVLSPGLDRQLALRARLGLRNSAHSLVKMLDPIVGGGLLLASATHPAYLTTMRTLLTACRARALLLRGSEGEPFANPRRRPAIEYLHDGVVELLYDAEHDSLRSLPQLPASCDAETTAEWTRDVLDGRVALPPPIVSQLAGCVYASGRTVTLVEADALVAAGCPTPFAVS